MQKKKKRSATMQHSARTSLHITYTILSHKQTVVLKFKKGTAQIRGGTAQFVQFPRLKKRLVCCISQIFFM